jgi:hydrogenase expression/formation protein HypC
MCLAIPGRIKSIHGDEPLTRLGKVDFGGVVKDVALAYVPDAGVGDYVLVHVGFAISQIDEEEAAKTMKLFREMEELADREEAD